MRPSGLLVVALLVLSTPAWALEQVKLQLKWTHAFQFAGYYVAKERGYYREAGLDVRIEPSRPGLNPVDEVLTGRAQFGVGSSSLLLARQAGKPVVVLAVLFQHSPLVLIARQDHALQGIHDLAGKPVMLEPQSEELLAYLRRERVPVDHIQVRTHSYSIQDLIDGRVAAMSAYASNEPYALEQAHVPYQIYTPRSAGIDFYGDNLFTSEREIRAHPERVEAFRAASLRGWQDAMAHPGEAADLILAHYAPELTREFLLFEAQRMSDLMRTDLVEVGHMMHGRWRHMADTYTELGLMDADLPLDDFLYRPPHDRALSRAKRGLMVALIVILLGALTFAYILSTNRQLARTRDELRLSEGRYRMLTEQMKDVVWTLDTTTGRFTYVSPSVAGLRGYTAQEVMAAPLTEALTREGMATVSQVLAAALARFVSNTAAASEYTTLELEQPCKDGTSVWTEVITHLMRNPENGHIEVHGVTRDISERRRQQEHIRYMAQHDQLTGLANRALFSHHLKQSLAAAHRDGTRLGLVYLDLDHFKPVNDRLGHAIGDQLLQAVAQRMQASLRASDILARIGGDEFMILLRSVADGAAAVQAANKVRLALEQPFPIDGQALCISSSQGIALFPEDGQDEITLARRADNALYVAKQMGRNRVVLHGQTEELSTQVGLDQAE